MLHHMKDGREKLTKKLNFLKAFNEQVRIQAEKGYSASKIMKVLNLKERWGIRILSHGMLSKFNMVQAVLNDIKTETKHESLAMDRPKPPDARTSHDTCNRCSMHQL